MNKCLRGILEVNLFQKMSAPGPAWALYAHD